MDFPFDAIREIVKSKEPSKEAIKVVLEYARRFESIHLPGEQGSLNLAAYFVDNRNIVQIIPPEVWREVIRKYGDAK